MRAIFIKVLCLSLLSISWAAGKEIQCIAIQASLVLKVSHPATTAKQIIEKVEALGGYFSIYTEQNLVLKVPRDKTQDMIAFASGLGIVVEKNFAAKDIGAELDEMRTRLQSQSQILEKFLAIMYTANQEGIVAVESEITKLLEEIDTLKGALLLLEHRLEYAQLSVSFRFRERKAPIPSGVSSFPWLNTMNMEDLIKEFSHD